MTHITAEEQRASRVINHAPAVLTATGLVSGQG